MLTFLFVFIAIAFGLLLFSSIQDQIPDELAFLRAGSASATTPASAPAAKVFEYRKWRVTQVGATLEAVKSFNGPLTVNGRTYAAPIIGILCHENRLDVRLETKEATTGVKSSLVGIGDAPVQEWSKGVGTNLFPPTPSNLLRALVSAKQGAAVTLSYRDLGTQTSTLDTNGLAELTAQFPANCRP